jgi:hypothetical protein
MNKKFVNTLLVGAFFVGISTPKLALFWENKEQKIRERVETSLEVNNPGTGAQQEIKERVRNFAGTRSAIGSGKVIAIDGSTLTITKDDKTYTVLIDAKTKFRRRFWGNSSLEEIAVNNIIDVIGRWQNEERTQIQAIIIRNLSVQKRYGVFFGVVTSVNDKGFVMETAKRENQAVTVSTDTKLVDRTMEDMTLNQILVGHRVRVKGTWDSSNSTITGVTQVKDFSIPILPSASPEAE